MEERNSLGVNANKNQSYWVRDEIVPETKSFGGYIRGNINLEHNFEIKSSAAPNITRFLRIDFWDKFYVKEFSIFHFNPLRDDLTQKGQVITGDDMFQHWIYLNPPAGKYQINTVGGNYRYRVILFKSDLRLTDAIQLKVNTATQVTLRLPEAYDDFPKALSYRIDNRPVWLTTYSRPPHKKFKLEVEPASIYEAKMKLFVKGVFETKYSPSIIITEHQKWVETVEPDYDLLDLELMFYFRMKQWPHRIEVNLLIKFPDDEEWTKFSKEIWKIPGFIEFRLRDQIYNRLNEDNMVIEWRLHFKDPQIDDREVWGPIRKYELKKRVKNEIFANTCHLDTKEPLYTLLLVPDGRFALKKRIAKKIYVRNGLRGEYTIENTSDGKKRIHLMPKYGISFDVSKIEQSTSACQILLPELLQIIFAYVGSAYDRSYQKRKFEPFRRLSMVCKLWFNLVTKKVLAQLFDGELIIKPESSSVLFNNWIEFRTLW